MVYESIQASKMGMKKYFFTPQNHADMLYIWGSVLNVVFQFIFGPHHIGSRVIMTILVIPMIAKTFFFLRVFKTLTPIVVML